MGDPREHTWRILREVVDRLDPRRLVGGALELDGEALSVSGIPGPVACSGRLIVISVGKASVSMAAGAFDALGDRVDTALAVTKAGIPIQSTAPDGLRVMEADHPVPSEKSLQAGHEILQLVRDLDERDTVLMLISGGGSALIEDLVEGVSLDDLQAMTDHLLRAGATINELNAIRRRLSRIKGGRLARAIAPAKVINLVVSDVLGNPLQDIASGPTVKPPDQDATFDAVMSRSDLISALPPAVRKSLERDSHDATPWPENVIDTRILADAELAARFAIESAEQLGYRVQTLGFDFQGEAREFGRTWATIARHAAHQRDAFPLPLALIGAGELTVTVRGNGTGGRNTEMALAAAMEIDSDPAITITSFATDGDDGVSGCAGGIVDGSTAQRAREMAFDLFQRLGENDSANVLNGTGDVIDIGATGTNVNDIYLALIEAVDP